MRETDIVGLAARGPQFLSPCAILCELSAYATRSLWQEIVLARTCSWCILFACLPSACLHSHVHDSSLRSAGCRCVIGIDSVSFAVAVVCEQACP